MEQKKFVDKVYKLLKNASPLSYVLPTRHTKRYALLYFDKIKGINRELRYSKNQRSPFVDEQDGNFLLEPIVFENGFLSVPANNQVLQEFLSYHPLNGISFSEVDKSMDASKEVERLDIEADALIEARKMDIGQTENIYRVLFGKNPELISSAELKRDVRLFARSNPQNFLDAVKDPALNAQAGIQSFFDKKLLNFRKNNTEVWFNTPTTKTRMMVIPFGADEKSAVMAYLHSDEGLDSLKMLESFAENE